MKINLQSKKKKEQLLQPVVTNLNNSGCAADYDVYIMSGLEKKKYILLGSVVLFVTGFVFFQSLAVSFLLSLGGVLYPGLKNRDLVVKRKKELNIQFKDALYSLSSTLSAGRSLESSFKTALGDLKILYPDGETYIIREFEFICRRIEMNEPVESALADFGKRSHLEDISNFAEVVSICLHTGGNLVDVVKNTSNIITGKIEMEQEIDLLLSGRKYEQKILTAMPVLFIGLINIGGTGYTDSLYTSATGYLLMFTALAILIVSYLLSKRIMDIRV